MLSGIPVHIRHRGNNRQRCFYEDQDRSFYLLQLCRLLATSQCVLHAYCLMTNHVHLLLTPRALDSCARLMKALGQLHTQYMNRTYGRSGSLWEGRFRSSLVQSERYLLECYRYVELNPVEARIVEHPGDYAWSSYAANVGAARSALVTPHDEYLRLGRSDEARTHAYRALFDVPLAPERIREIRAATDGNFALGDDNFKRGVSLALGRRAYPGVPGRPSCAAAVDGNQDDLFEERKNVVCP
jgi:putative transposase